MIVLNIILAIGAAMADHLFPRLGPVERFIRGLPLGRDD